MIGSDGADASAAAIASAAARDVDKVIVGLNLNF